MAFLELKRSSQELRQRRDARTEVLKDIDLAIEEGEFVAIVGFSGSGKTTLINLMAGLDRARCRRGAASAASRSTEPGPERGVVFQSYSLMPWLTVRGNVALAVDAVFKQPRREPNARARVDRYIDMVGLAHAADRKPAELPAACASASPWRARWPWTRRCCCSTSRCRRSTR